MSGGFTLSFAEARRRLKQNPQARWRTVAAGFEGEVWPEVSPSFQLKPGDVVFTIGSCFAREIEQHLVALRCQPDAAGAALHKALTLEPDHAAAAKLVRRIRTPSAPAVPIAGPPARAGFDWSALLRFARPR